jgi:hypothetical protein
MDYQQAETEMADLMRNPFGFPRGLMYRIAYQTPTLPRGAARRPWVPAGAQWAYLKAAAIRTLTQGEG